MWCHHGTVKRGTPGDTLERVERALELLLLEDLLNDSLNNRSPGAITYKFNELNLIGRNSLKNKHTKVLKRD